MSNTTNIAGRIIIGTEPDSDLNLDQLKSSKADDKLKESNSSEEDESSLLLSEETNQDEGVPGKPEEGNEFSLRNHPSDHGIYSQRSLMSTAVIIENQDLDEEESEIFKTRDYSEKEWQMMFRAFDMNSEGVTTSFLIEIEKRTNLIEEIFSRLKPACQRDLNHVRMSMRKHKLWALRMVDSNGRIPSGISYGRFTSPGDYEECLSVRVDENVYVRSSRENTSRDLNDEGELKTRDHDSTTTVEHFKFDGKYCLLDFRLPLPERPKNKLLSVHESVLDLTKTEMYKQFPEIQNYSVYASVFYEIGYMHGVCIPDSCEIEDLTKSITKSLEGIYVIVNNTVDCQLRSDYKGGAPLRTSQIISITLLSILFLNAALATVVQSRSKRKSCSETYLDGMFKKIGIDSRFYSDCFSVQTNFYRLSKPDPKGLTIVHYTRLVAMALTVITHTGAMGTLEAITKPADATENDSIFRDFLPQMLANAFTSIQVFFFMAGFMLVVSSYPSIKRDGGRLPFLDYAIKRAIRLMPGLAATIAINFIWPLLVDGPMLNYFIRVIVVPCESSWYRTLGFLSNFDHVEKMCLRHSYFSASDYQLHMMAFPLLLLLHKSPTIALTIAAVLTLTGFVAQVIMTLTKTILPFVAIDYLDKEAFFNVIHYIHHPVWNHMSAFFYGFIIGYLVVKRIRVNLSAKTVSRVWWVLGPMGFLSIFAPYFWNHYKRPILKWHMVLYVIFDRFTLLTACAWLTYTSMVLLPAKRAEEEANRIGVRRKQEHEIISEIPRQNSTPNLQSLEAVELDSQKKSSKSIGDLSSEPKESEARADQQASSERTAKRNAHKVSNVSTIFLILSRLTFQLYLFNMVVLWVDVNHSKYLWYFSYYFTIVKACAVYICSSIMAMIFFVTLESPCLSLYIAWVKSREEAWRRKKVGVRGDEVFKNGQEWRRCESSDGTILNKTTRFTFIDLASPDGNAAEHQQKQLASSQTKM